MPFDADVGGVAGSKKVTSQIATTHLLHQKLEALDKQGESTLVLDHDCAEQAGLVQSRIITWGVFPCRKSHDWPQNSNNGRPHAGPPPPPGPLPARVG